MSLSPHEAGDWVGPPHGGHSYGSLLNQRGVEQVRQPDTSPLQPIPHEGHVELKVRGVNLDDLLFPARRERLPSLVIDTFRSRADTVLHRFPPRDLKRLVRPPRNGDGYPGIFVTLG